jgi:hypothetical protein
MNLNISAGCLLPSIRTNGDAPQIIRLSTKRSSCSQEACGGQSVTSCVRMAMEYIPL